MAIEFIIISPFILLWYFNYIPLWLSLSIIFTLYWIPKWLIVANLERLFPFVIFRAKNQDKKFIALSFDDVPYEGGCHNEIITVLNEHHAKATFFAILNTATSNKYNSEDFISPLGSSPRNKYNQYPSLVAAVQAGHQIANHGITNSVHALKSSETLIKEIVTCDIAITSIYQKAGVKPPNKKLYRPGCGVFTNTMMKLAKELDHTITLGSVYPNDPIMRFDFINYWYIINHISAGDIVILHDRKWTPGLLKMLLPWLKDNGYRCVTIEDLMAQQ